MFLLPGTANCRSPGGRAAFRWRRLEHANPPRRPQRVEGGCAHDCRHVSYRPLRPWRQGDERHFSGRRTPVSTSDCSRPRSLRPRRPSPRTRAGPIVVPPPRTSPAPHPTTSGGPRQSSSAHPPAAAMSTVRAQCHVHRPHRPPPGGVKAARYPADLPTGPLNSRTHRTAERVRRLPATRPDPHQPARALSGIRHGNETVRHTDHRGSVTWTGR
jgi:hypothetical protein